MDDVVSLLLYVLMILAAFIASAYQAKKRKSQRSQGPLAAGNKENGKNEGGPDLGPLGDFFDMKDPRGNPPFYETLEEGQSVEEGGNGVESSDLYESMTAGDDESPAVAAREEVFRSPEIIHEEQPDLTRIKPVDDIMWETLDEEILEDIAAGEIVSEEEAARIAEGKPEKERLDWRKAIIYSEILKRKEF